MLKNIHIHTYFRHYSSCIALLTCLFLYGCSNPGIVKLSPDTYLLSRADRAGIFGNAARLKVEVIQEANMFAEKQGKVAIPISANETPVGPGRLATFEYQFRVVDKDDPEAKRTSLVPRADVIIEKSEKISADIKIKKDESKDIYTELTKLDDLRKRGIISEDEFAKMKQQLLNN